MAVVNELTTLEVCIPGCLHLTRKKAIVGQVYEILLESNSTLLLSELALFSQEAVFVQVPGTAGCPHENVEITSSEAQVCKKSMREAQVNSKILCLPAFFASAHLSHFGKFVIVAFKGIHGSPRHCANTVQSDQSGS